MTRFPGRAGGQVQHLVNSGFISDQISRHQFLAGSVQFVGKPDVQQFRQTRVGVKADSILVGDRHQHEVEQLLQTSEAFIEPFAQEAVINSS